MELSDAENIRRARIAYAAVVTAIRDPHRRGVGWNHLGVALATITELERRVIELEARLADALTFFDMPMFGPEAEHAELV